MWTATAIDSSPLVLKSSSLYHYSLQRLTTVAQEERSLVYWIGVYSGLSVAVCIVGVAKYGKFLDFIGEDDNTNWNKL